MKGTDCVTEAVANELAFEITPGTFPGHSRDTPGTRPGHSRDTSGTLPGGLRPHRQKTVCVWKLENVVWLTLRVLLVISNNSPTCLVFVC